LLYYTNATSLEYRQPATPFPFQPKHNFLRTSQFKRNTTSKNSDKLFAMILTPTITISTILLPLTSALSLDITSPSSIRNASAGLAYNLMSYYQTNASGTPPENVGTLPQPLYWWQAGAMWGGLVDYWAYTNDPSYNPTITQALLAQVGPDKNYMPSSYFSSLGNDDQAFWALAVLSAAESNFPSPTADPQLQWLALAEAVFNTQAPRWATKTCGGGLKWQIFESNAGYDYKNTVSNGAFFLISARLARYTGNATYIEWAERAWDWMAAIGLFDADYNVFDGTDEKINCTALNHIQWTYNPAILIHGTANLYNYTNGSSLWQDRTSGLLRSTIRNFYRLPNATDILYEAACEPPNTCNNDQYSFKAYLSRFLGKTAVLAPYTLPAIRTLLTTSAAAVAEACSAGIDDATCGQKWYVGGFDGNPGVGQQMSALEGVVGLVAVLPEEKFLNTTWTNGTMGGRAVQQWVPRTGPDVTIAVVAVTSTFDANAPAATVNGVPGQNGAGGQTGGSRGDGDDGESIGALQSRAELGAKVALPVIAAAAVEVGGLV
jgi:mannan endo-1,6-alpha-mannosidase